MANIALDIKANTSKALGEFKKLSRELDNKFLVQGLKLDVVKNAFRQINREFEQSLGSQGIAASESTGQIQRNAAAQLALYSKLGSNAARALTEETTKQLRELVAQGDLTKSVMQQALTIQGSIKFDGVDFEERSRKLTTDIAKLGQTFNDVLGNNKGLETLNSIVTGNLSVDDLQNLDLGADGAASNLIRETIREFSGGMFDSMSVVERSKVLEEVVEALSNEGNKFGDLLADLRKDAQSTVAFKEAIRQFTGIFSEGGILGPLMAIGKMEAFGFKPGDDLVDRNVLQLSAKLISTLFDQEEGLFAVLFTTLGDVFKFDPGKIIEPILRGTELLIGVFEGLTEFVRSPAFRNFLEIFKPFVDAIKSVETPEKITAEDINNGVNKIFGGIRGLLSNLNTYIANVDTDVVGDIVGNFLGQIINTLPDLITVVFTSIGKAIDFIIDVIKSDGFDGSQVGEVLASVANGLGSLIGKTFELIFAALPKLIGAALNGIGKLDAGGTLLVGGAIAEGLTRLFTGKGILGNLGNVLGGVRNRGRAGLGDLFNRRNPLLPGGAQRANVLASRGGEQQRWARLYVYLENILRALNGEGPLDDVLGGGRRRRPSRRAVNDRFQRRFNRRVPRGARFGRNITRGLRRIPGLRALTSTLRTGVPRISTALGGLRTSTRDLISTTRANTRIQANQFRAGLNKPPVALPGSSSRAFRAGEVARNLQRGAQNLPGQISNQASRATQAIRGVPQATRGLNARFMGTSPQAASRFTQRFGQFAGARRGITSVLGRAALPLLAAGTIFSAASILGSPGAKAEDLEKQGYSKEEIEQIRKQEKREKTRGLTGLGASLAGGAAGGAAGAKLGGLIGTFFGPGVGTAIGAGIGGVAGGVLGSIFGEEAVSALSDPVIDGITSFGESVGEWFSDTWSNISGGWNTATGAIGDFFGKEGPIQRFGRFAGDNIQGGVENIQKFFGEEGPIATVANWFKELPGKVAETIQKAGQDMFDGITGAVGGFTAGILRTVGLGDLADKIEGEDETNNFAGGFRYLGGRNAFNEYEGFQMPDGVTFVPLSSLDTSVSSSGGTTTNNLEVTVNVTGDDPKAIATEVIAEIDRIYQSVNV